MNPHCPLDQAPTNCHRRSVVTRSTIDDTVSILNRALFLSLSISLFFCLSLPLYVSLSLSLSYSQSFSLSPFIYLSVTRTLNFFLSICFFLSIFFTSYSYHLLFVPYTTRNKWMRMIPTYSGKRVITVIL